jgi:hypothetical protein
MTGRVAGPVSADVDDGLAALGAFDGDAGKALGELDVRCGPHESTHVVHRRRRRPTDVLRLDQARAGGARPLSTSLCAASTARATAADGAFHPCVWGASGLPQTTQLLQNL